MNTINTFALNDILAIRDNRQEFAKNTSLRLEEIQLIAISELPLPNYKQKKDPKFAVDVESLNDIRFFLPHEITENKPKETVEHSIIRTLLAMVQFLDETGSDYIKPFNLLKDKNITKERHLNWLLGNPDELDNITNKLRDLLDIKKIEKIEKGLYDCLIARAFTNLSLSMKQYLKVLIKDKESFSIFNLLKIWLNMLPTVYYSEFRPIYEQARKTGIKLLLSKIDNEIKSLKPINEMFAETIIQNKTF